MKEVHQYYGNVSQKVWVLNIILQDFIVIACDGLWDTVSPDAAKDSVFKSLKDNKGKADRNNRIIEQLV